MYKLLTEESVQLCSLFTHILQQGSCFPSSHWVLLGWDHAVSVALVLQGRCPEGCRASLAGRTVDHYILLP